MENATSTSVQNIKTEIKKLDQYAYYIGGSAVILLFVFTILATQFHLWFDFTNTGEIGDTIGGLTSPIIGIFSASLIYLSFRAQINANYIVQSQIEKQENSEKEKKELELISNLLNGLNKEINAFSYKNLNGLKNGADAVIEYLDDASKNFLKDKPSMTSFFSNTKNHQYIGLLNIFDKLIQIIIDSDLKKTDKDYFKAQLEYVLNYKLVLCGGDMYVFCEHCNKEHFPLPCVIIKRLRSIADNLMLLTPEPE